MQEPDAIERRPNRGGLTAFFVCAGIVVVMDFASGLVALPRSAVPWVSLAVTFFSLAVPIYALFRGSAREWTRASGWLFVAAGAVFQCATIAAAKLALHDKGAGAGGCLAAGQAGLLTWCLGAGGLVSRLMKDRNLLLPVTIFLAALDMLLVLTPTGLTHMIMSAAPTMLGDVGYAVPRATSLPPRGIVRQLAVVGPADLLFLAMFFASLHKFGMRAGQTVWAMIPTLVGYLLIVVVFGGVSVGRVSLGALPALVPIGAVVLLVNGRLFKLSRDEIVSTVVVTAFVLGLLCWFATRPVEVRLIDEHGRPVRIGR